MKKFLLACCLLLLCALPAKAEVRVEENLIWYRLHLGTGIGNMAVSPDLVRTFIDSVITPEFPDGLTVFEARGQWTSPDAGLIRERTTVIDVLCPDTEENKKKINKIAEIYVEKFKKAKASLYVTRMPGIDATLHY